MALSTKITMSPWEALLACGLGWASIQLPGTGDHTQLAPGTHYYAWPGLPVWNSEQNQRLVSFSLPSSHSRHPLPFGRPGKNPVLGSSRSIFQFLISPQNVSPLPFPSNPHRQRRTKRPRNWAVQLDRRAAIWAWILKGIGKIERAGENLTLIFSVIWSFLTPPHKCVFLSSKHLSRFKCI